MKSSLRRIPFIMYLMFLVLPLIPAVVLSFQATLDHPEAMQGQWTIINFKHVLQSAQLMGSIGSSVSYVTLNIIFSIAVALPAAYGFSRYRFFGDTYLFFAFIACRITPPVVLVLPVFELFSSLRLINTPAGIALAHCLFNIPVSIWILESFISAVPQELDETAFLEGHSLLSFFIQKLIPVIAPGIGVACFFCFMFSWVEVVFARILTVTNGKPISMAVYNLFGFGTDIGLVMAMTLISILPGAILIYFVRNHIAKGFTIG
ncbi:carbohydrate ABC transporter permease [Desulforhopalus sp. 52FAK]